MSISPPKCLSTDAARVQWLMNISHTVSNIVSELEDEGDRVYFGSTNDADTLREINDILTHFWHSQQPTSEDDKEPTP